MNFSKELIDIFKDDLCKDQREMKVFRDMNGCSVSNLILRKHNLSLEEYRNEINVIDYLSSYGIQGIPRILEHGFVGGVPYIDIEYFNGIRVYNLLAYLNEIAKTEPELKGKVHEIRLHIKNKCIERQIAIQKGLIAWAKDNNKTAIYPQQKLKNIVYILARVMELDSIDYSKLAQELDYLIEKFEQYASVPFRDATSKNMVIYMPELYLENFIDADKDVLSADQRRKEYVLNMIRENKYQAILDAPIIDFDFSSCEHLTTVHDDPIGFNCHEVLWNGMIATEELMWCGDLSSNVGENIAISFIVRYLRFGGRKMCYHIFHPYAYAYRFKYDDENFYFDHLNEIIDYYWKDARKVIPQFMQFIDMVVEFDKEKIIDSVDEFVAAYPDCNRKFYLDLFPY